MKLIKLYMEWCSPCKRLGLLLDKINHWLEVESIDVDSWSKPLQEYIKQYNMTDIPTLILMDWEKEVGRIQWQNKEQDILQLIKK